MAKGRSISTMKCIMSLIELKGEQQDLIESFNSLYRYFGYNEKEKPIAEKTYNMQMNNGELSKTIHSCEDMRKAYDLQDLCKRCLCSKTVVRTARNDERNIIRHLHSDPDLIDEFEGLVAEHFSYEIPRGFVRGKNGKKVESFQGVPIYKYTYKAIKEYQDEYIQYLPQMLVDEYGIAFEEARAIVNDHHKFKPIDSNTSLDIVRSNVAKLISRYNDSHMDMFISPVNDSTAAINEEHRNSQEKEPIQAKPTTEANENPTRTEVAKDAPTNSVAQEPEKTLPQNEEAPKPDVKSKENSEEIPHTRETTKPPKATTKSRKADKKQTSEVTKSIYERHPEENLIDATSDNIESIEAGIIGSSRVAFLFSNGKLHILAAARRQVYTFSPTSPLLENIKKALMSRTTSIVTPALYELHALEQTYLPLHKIGSIEDGYKQLPNSRAEQSLYEILRYLSGQKVDESKSITDLMHSCTMADKALDTMLSMDAIENRRAEEYYKKAVMRTLSIEKLIAIKCLIVNDSKIKFAESSYDKVDAVVLRSENQNGIETNEKLGNYKRIIANLQRNKHLSKLSAYITNVNDSYFDILTLDPDKVDTLFDTISNSLEIAFESSEYIVINRIQFVKGYEKVNKELLERSCKQEEVSDTPVSPITE